MHLEVDCAPRGVKLREHPLVGIRPSSPDNAVRFAFLEYLRLVLSLANDLIHSRA